eukprot:1299424-Rhodomonas_salina.3
MCYSRNASANAAAAVAAAAAAGASLREVECPLLISVTQPLCDVFGSDSPSGRGTCPRSRKQNLRIQTRGSEKSICTGNAVSCL